MTREQAKHEATKIFSELARQRDNIVRQAKQDGVWIGGLDGDKKMFEDVEREAKEKIKLLESMIDD